MICVRCESEETKDDEKLCEFCLNFLRQKFEIGEGEDVLENPQVKQLIEDYENYY